MYKCWQLQFIDAWHQIWKLREIYFWKNTLIHMRNYPVCNICTIIKYRMGLIVVELFKWWHIHNGPQSRIISFVRMTKVYCNGIRWLCMLSIWDNNITMSHYSDVIMTTIASLITSLAVVYSAVYSDADQRKHQSSASLAFVWGIHRDRWIPRTKGQLRGKCFHLMTSSCKRIIYRVIRMR